MVRTIIRFLCYILAVLCAIYGLVVKSKGYGTAFFVIWLIFAVSFCVLSYSVKIKLWRKLHRWQRITIIAVFAIGIGLFAFVEILIAGKLNEKGEDNLDYIIVLGAMVYEDGPSSILGARLKSAVAYLNENPNTICIVSGGQGNDEPFSEAEGMRRFLVEKGIDESRIIMEDKSLNTVQNIQNSMKLITKKDARVGIVTSNFHVFRACSIAKKQGIENICGISANVVKAYMPENMLREFFGVVKDTVFGNM